MAYYFTHLIFNGFRLKVAQITAVSIETAFQNGGIAFILLQLSLPKPYGDIAAVAPVSIHLYFHDFLDIHHSIKFSFLSWQNA